MANVPYRKLSGNDKCIFCNPNCHRTVMIALAFQKIDFIFNLYYKIRNLLLNLLASVCRLTFGQIPFRGQSLHFDIHGIFLPECVVDYRNEKPFVFALHSLKNIIVIRCFFLHIVLSFRQYLPVYFQGKILFHFYYIFKFVF